MKKNFAFVFISLVTFLFIPQVHAESLTCQYNMNSGDVVVVKVDENRQVSAEVKGAYISARTSSLLYESFLANNKTVLKCPSTIYQAIGDFGAYYEICSNQAFCESIDLAYYKGNLDTSNSTEDIPLNQEEKYMSCEYATNGAFVGSNNAKVLYTVKNGKASFSLLYRTNSDTTNYVLTPSDDFEIANSCDEQGSLWISKLQKANRTISSKEDSEHHLELTLVLDEDREILDQDQTNEANFNNQHGFNPGDICEGDNCDISLSNICLQPNVARTLKFVGLLLFILKIFFPTIIIVMGMVNLFQIIMSGKDDQAKKYGRTIVTRIIIGVAIYLLPGIFQFVYETANDIIGSESVNNFGNCVGCLFDPNDSESCKIDTNS